MSVGFIINSSEMERLNFFYWYNTSSKEDVAEARKDNQERIDSLLMKYNVPCVNFLGVVFSENPDLK